MQNKGFAKYININGKFEPFENERDIIDAQAKEIERLNKEKSILEKTFRLVIQHEIGEINYAELDRANRTIEEFYKNNKQIEKN